MTTDEKLDQIADEIRKVSEAMRRFRDGPLKKRAVVLLLEDATGVPRSTITKVLDGLNALEDKYLTPVKS